MSGGLYFHCLWSYRLIQDYWCKILCEMLNILSLDLSPLSLLLGLPDSKVTSLANRRLFDVITFSAWKNNILQWTSDKAPSVKGWQKVLMQLLLSRISGKHGDEDSLNEGL